MSTRKVEFLADRRQARKGPDKTLRALRHLDAARAKLEVLMAIRREMKIQLLRARDEKQTALTRVEQLEHQLQLQENEIEALRVLFDEQSAELEQCRQITCRHRSGADEPDGPALTVLAVQKAVSRRANTAAAETATGAAAPAEPAPGPAGLLSRIWRRRNPGADQTA